MAKTFKLIDLVAVVGTVTMILGIYLGLSFLFLSDTFGATRTDILVKESADMQVSMRWIQPILGQAIMEDTLAKQQQRGRVGDKVPDRPTIVAHRPTQANVNSLSSAYAETLMADHAARVQWIIGRLIVELTRYRIQAGVSETDWLADEGNQRIIAIAQQAGEQLNGAFKAKWQVRPGEENAYGTRNQASEEVGLIF